MVTVVAYAALQFRTAVTRHARGLAGKPTALIVLQTMGLAVVTFAAVWYLNEDRGVPKVILILGALLATLAIDAPWLTTLEIRPAEMRRELGLPGTASKEQMHEEVRSRIGCPVCKLPFRGHPTNWCLPGPEHHWLPDALDSWAVAWAAYRMCDRAAERGAA